MRTLLADESQLTGSVITKEDNGYESARTMWNRAIEKYPLGIIYCETEEDIRNSILWAKAHRVPVRIRSGGHHYNGYSTGNDVLIIDVSKMQGITIDEVQGTVTIEAGVRNRELYEFLGERDYPFPGGGCPTVGVVGFALGGGWGYSGRLLGLGCDSILEARLINHQGELITVNSKQHPDLFWALKGSGGGQFGVVVSLTFTLPEKRVEATLIRIEYSDVTRDQQMKMFQFFQEHIETMCWEVNFKLSFYHSKEKGVGMLLIGICYGNADRAHEIIEPFIKLGYKMHLLVQPMSVLEVNRWIQDAHPDFEHYKSSGRFVKNQLMRPEIEQILDSINVLAEGAVYAAASCYGMGGKMKEPENKESAFYYRESLYILGFQTVWEDNQYSLANREWFGERFKIIEDLTWGSFVNFPAEEVQNYRKAYYGAYHLRLSEIKQQYDAEGVFDFEQSL